MLWFICFFNYADRQAISAVFPALEKEFHFNKEQLGRIGSAFMWTYAGFAIFAGFVCDRFRRKDLILGGCVFWSLVTMMTGWCSKLWHFLTVRALEGFGETFYFPASMSLVSDYHGKASRSRALSFHQSSVYFGTILGSWFGAWLAMRFGWRTSFYFFGGAGLLLSLVLWRFLREPVRGAADGKASEDLPKPLDSTSAKPTVWETLQLVFRSPGVPLLMLAFVCANSVATVFLVWTPSFLTDKFHYDLATAGLNGTVFIHASSAVAVPAAGWCADRLAGRIAGGRIVIQAAGLAVGAIFVSMVGRAREESTLIVAMIVFGICKGFYDSGIFASLYDSIEPRARGTAAGIMNTVGWGGGALGPWLVGWAAEHGSRPTKIENMSAAISWGGLVYGIGAVLLVGAILQRMTIRITKSE